MNNYIVINAEYAYITFGLAALAIGGLTTGIAAPAFFASTKSIKNKISLACSFFIAIVLTGLGFNTLDFMSGNFYWTNLHYPPPVYVPLIGAVDVWNYYFFFFVAPLWIGGFILGVTASYYTFVYRPKHLVATYPANRIFGGLFRHSIQTAKKKYVFETEVLSRKRKPTLKLEKPATIPFFTKTNAKNLFRTNSINTRTSADANSKRE